MTADLRDAQLFSADLTGARLEKANLTGAILDGADLTGSHLLHATFDESTRWPDGFNPNEVA
jgi:uncharacterized protein YjbI with pentapeptide repeats